MMTVRKGWSGLRNLMLLKAIGGEGPKPESGYVQDGLVFHLDGIDKGSDQTKWIDKAGGKIITLTNCAFVTDGVDFSDSGSYGLLDGTSSGVTPSEGTIEICADIYHPSMCCIIRGENTAIRFYHNGPGHRFEISRSTNDPSFDNVPADYSKLTASVNFMRGYCNGTALNATTGSTWMSSITSPCIIIGGAGGISNPAASGKFGGVLHSIRIYSRQLSEAEILQNQRYDNSRFNLGLTI